MTTASGGGGTVIAPNATTFPTRAARARGVVADLLIVTAILWALPLALAAVGALARLL